MKTFGPYCIERLLRRGRLCATYLGHDQHDGHAVALKVAPRGVDLAHEWQVAAEVRSPRLIALHEHGFQGDESYLAMAYAPGGDLGRADSPLPAGRILDFALQAAEALGAMHEAGWVHRDLKPANLLLREDASLALADFGSACRRGAGKTDGSAITGTPRYAAPEQSRGVAAQPAADVYSLGVMLHEWLAGVPPFRGVTSAELLAQHLLAEPPRLPAQHADWQPLINMLLAKEPGLRLADGRAVAQVLRRLQPLLLTPLALPDPS
jgi:serine/threonine-protein kinase PpkA